MSETAATKSSMKINVNFLKKQERTKIKMITTVLFANNKKSTLQCDVNNYINYIDVKLQQIRVLSFRTPTVACFSAAGYPSNQ